MNPDPSRELSILTAHATFTTELRACERGGVALEGVVAAIVDLVEGLPRQIARLAIRIGPAFGTYEEAAAAARYRTSKGLERPGHVLEVFVSHNGTPVAHWFEASERGVGNKFVGLALGHTEQKALLRIRPRPGLKIEFHGWIKPCSRHDGCEHAIGGFVKENDDVTIEYLMQPRQGGQTTFFWDEDGIMSRID